MRAIFRQPGFTLLFAGLFASMLGVSLMLIVLAGWVNELTGSNGAAASSSSPPTWCPHSLAGASPRGGLRRRLDHRHRRLPVRRVHGRHACGAQLLLKEMPPRGARASRRHPAHPGAIFAMVEAFGKPASHVGVVISVQGIGAVLGGLTSVRIICEMGEIGALRAAGVHSGPTDQPLSSEPT